MSSASKAPLFAVVSLLVLGGLFASSAAQLTRTYANNAVLHTGSGLTFYWNMVPSGGSPTTIQVGLKASVAGYISVGFSSLGTMGALDCMMCYMPATGTTGQMADYYVNGHNTPTQDAHQDYTKVSVTRSGTTLYCEFDRLLSNAADTTRDFLLTTSSTRATNIVWGIHTKTVPASLSSWAQHDAFGAKQVILCPGCVAPTPAPVAPLPPVAPGTPVPPPLAPAGTGAFPNMTLDGVVTPGEYPSHVSLANANFDLYWKVDLNAQTITFAMTANGQGYAALGIGTTMTNSDNMIGYFKADPAGGPDILVVDDYWSTGQTTPSEDTSLSSGTRDISAYGGAVANGKITIEFTRPLAASEANDQAFTVGQSVDITYAWTALPSDFLLNHGPANRGTAKIFISADGSQTVPPPDRKPGLRLAHLILMYLAFAVFAPGAAVFARYGRVFKNELWFRVHRIMTILSFATGLLGLFVILGGVMAGHFQTENHAQIGIAVLAIALVMVGMGIWRIKTPEPEDTDNAVWHTWYQIHRWLGRLMIILAQAAIFTGIYEYQAPQFFYGWHAGFIATFVSFVIFAELRTWKHMSKKVEGVKSHA